MRCLLPLLLLAPAVAQTVSLQVRTLSVVTARASLAGGAGNTQSVPANALLPQAILQAQDTSATSSATMDVTWGASTGSWFATFGLSQSAYVLVPALPTAVAEANPVDLLLELAATQPAVVDIGLSQSFYSTQVSPPAFPYSVDLGNDGAIEWDESSPASIALPPITIGPVPTLLRVRTAMVQTGPGGQTSNLMVYVSPHNDLQTQPLAGCNNLNPFVVQPVFPGRGVEVYVASSNDPVVGVFGLSSQPQLLSPLFQSTCWLVPSPDFLVYLPPMVPFLLPIPAAVRPVTVWAQGVGVTPLGLTTTSGEIITAF